MPPHPLSKQALGIILAAGRGRRMGCLKQTLPWGDSTVIAHIFDTLQPHCAMGIAVVVGSHRDEIIAALTDRTYSIIESDTNAQQYESICRGLDYFMNETEAPFTLIQPADHPFIPDSVVRMLFDSVSRTGQQQAAIIPTFQDKGGHPVLVPQTVAAEILSWAQTISPTTSLPTSPSTDTHKSSQFQGLKTFWHEHPDLIRRIETNEPGITADLDTPVDYQQHHP